MTLESEIPINTLGEELVFGPSTSNSKKTRHDSFLVPHTTPSAQPTIDSKWKMEKDISWQCMARWWYDAYIPFHASNSSYYQYMIDL
jgi:hypothetical protein